MNKALFGIWVLSMIATYSITKVAIQNEQATKSKTPMVVQVDLEKNPAENKKFMDEQIFAMNCVMVSKYDVDSSNRVFRCENRETVCYTMGDGINNGGINCKFR